MNNQRAFYEHFKLHTSWKTFEKVKLCHIRNLNKFITHQGKILFVACGYGYEVNYFNAIGVDIAFNCIKNLDNVVQADARSLPFMSNCFDYVISNSFHHLWPSYNKCFSEMRRVCKKGGRIILQEPHRYSVYNYIYNTVFRIWRIEKGMLMLTPRKLIKMFKGFGMRDIQWFHKGIDPIPQLRGIWANFYIGGRK